MAIKHVVWLGFNPGGTTAAFIPTIGFGDFEEEEETTTVPVPYRPRRADQERGRRRRADNRTRAER